MKKIVSVITVILAIFATANSAFAQENNKLLSNEELFKNAEYILEIEGMELFASGYFSYLAKEGCNPDDIYSYQFGIVKYIYKDNTRSVQIGDTVLIMKKGGYLWDFDCGYIQSWKGQYNPAGVNDFFISGDQSYITFSVKSDYPASEHPYVKQRVEKFVKLKYLQDNSKGNFYITGRIKGLNDLSFNNREELYSYMSQYENYGVDVNNYNETNNAYWGKKYMELEEFKKNFPKFEINDKEIKTKNQLDSVFRIFIQQINTYFISNPESSIDFEHKKHNEYNEFYKKFIEMQEEKIKKAKQTKETKQKEIELKKKLLNQTKSTTNELWANFENVNLYYALWQTEIILSLIIAQEQAIILI